MAFLHSVIGDNTKENREHLEKLGYTPLRFCLNGKYLYARSCTWANKNRTWQEPYFATDNNIDNSSKYINCIGNPQLFKAVAAMRDDSDYMQWFVDAITNDWWFHDSKRPQMDSFNYSEEGDDADKVGEYDPIHGDYAAFNPYRKATLSELQAHFQRV